MIGIRGYARSAWMNRASILPASLTGRRYFFLLVDLAGRSSIPLTEDQEIRLPRPIT